MNGPLADPDSVSSSQADLESIRLHFGAPLQIQQLDEGGQKYNLKFIGAVKGKSILVTLPIVGTQALRMPAGQSYIFRGFNGKHAYAFTSHVIQTCAQPFPYAHFSYPDSIESKVIRKTLRVDVNLAASVMGGDEAIPVTMIDLSMKGAMIDTSRPIGEIGAALSVRFDVVFGVIKTGLTLLAKIRNVSRAKDGTSIRVGVEFGKITQDDMLMLNNYILSVSNDM